MKIKSKTIFYTGMILNISEYPMNALYIPKTNKTVVKIRKTYKRIIETKNKSSKQ